MCKPNKIHLSFSVITREFIGPLLGGTITELTDFQSSSMVLLFTILTSVVRGFRRFSKYHRQLVVQQK